MSKKATYYLPTLNRAVQASSAKEALQVVKKPRSNKSAKKTERRGKKDA